MTIHKIQEVHVRLFIITFFILLPFGANALTYPISSNSDIVGSIQYSTVRPGESLGDIGRRYDIGVYEMMEANPGVNPWTPKPGTKVVIPSEFILPPGERKGIILNLAEMRLYFFHPDEAYVTTHPVGIGRVGWSTPLTSTRVIKKEKDPTWTPPKSIRAASLKKGRVLPAYVPPGPENPLGNYALYLALNGYLMHGTNRPGGIGVRSSSGCIRMFNEDIQHMYEIVPIGTRLNIIHMPYKLGYKGSRLYLEAHQPLSEPKYGNNRAYNLNKAIESKNISPASFDWKGAEKEIKRTLGYPVELN